MQPQRFSGTVVAIVGLSCLATGLVVAIAVVVAVRSLEPSVPANQPPQQKRQLEDYEIVSKADEILRTAGSRTLTNEEWEIVTQAELLRPAKVWDSDSTDATTQRTEFTKWAFKEGFIIPEVRDGITDWIMSDSESIDEVFTNKPTGAQYHVTGKKYGNGPFVEIKFVGNTNW